MALATASEPGAESSPSVGVRDGPSIGSSPGAAVLMAGELECAGHEAEIGNSFAVDHRAHAYLPALRRLEPEMALAGAGPLDDAAEGLACGFPIAEELGLCHRAGPSPARARDLMRRCGDSARANDERERATALLCAISTAGFRPDPVIRRKNARSALLRRASR